jgi:hypothetical protein
MAVEQQDKEVNKGNEGGDDEDKDAAATGDNGLSIYCLFTACAVSIRCLFTAYPLSSHCLVTVYSLLSGGWWWRRCRYGTAGHSVNH